LGFLRDFWVGSRGGVRSWVKNGGAGVKMCGLGKIGKVKMRKNAPEFYRKSTFFSTFERKLTGIERF